MGTNDSRYEVIFNSQNAMVNTPIYRPGVGGGRVNSKEERVMFIEQFSHHMNWSGHVKM